MTEPDKPKYYNYGKDKPMVLDPLSHAAAVAAAPRQSALAKPDKPKYHMAGVMPAPTPTVPSVPAPPTQFDLQSSGLAGTKTLLTGPPGSGKTTSIITAIKAGLNLAVIITDPGGEESLLDAVKLYDVDLDRLHYAYVAPATASWANLRDMATKINMMGYEDLTKLKMGIAKSGHTQFLDLIDTCANFVCQRSGKVIGPIDALGTDWMVAVDSASGLNVMAMQLMVGGKPVAHQGEWGVAMNAEEKLIMKWCADLRCFFTLTAHVEKSMDETIGKPIHGPGFLGSKLAPRLPRFFSDHFTAYREGSEFFWSTIDSRMDLKARNLPLNDKITPSFEQIVTKWRQRTEQTKQSVPEPETK